MRWAAIRVAVDGSEIAAEAASLLLREAGCNGVATDIGAHDEVVAVTGYLPEDDRLHSSRRKIEAALLVLPELGIEGTSTEANVQMVEEEDWANAWKQYFKPIRVGRHLIVTPPWETPDAGELDKVIVIDPGMAFGTGTHPTTQLCLAALEDYIRPEANQHVADIGTGSGILAIGAAKLGAESIFATDIDPLAARIAGENAKVNGVHVEIADRFDSATQYDVLVANILANTLIELAEKFAASIRAGGIYIASGIIEGRENDVRLLTEVEGFIALETRHQGEWVALVFRRLDGEGN